jgi:hypothetical protein
LHTRRKGGLRLRRHARRELHGDAELLTLPPNIQHQIVAQRMAAFGHQLAPSVPGSAPASPMGSGRHRSADHMRGSSVDVRRRWRGRGHARRRPGQIPWDQPPLDVVPSAAVADRYGRERRAPARTSLARRSRSAPVSQCEGVALTCGVAGADGAMPGGGPARFPGTKGSPTLFPTLPPNIQHQIVAQRMAAFGHQLAPSVPGSAPGQIPWDERQSDVRGVGIPGGLHHRRGGCTSRDSTLLPRM